MGPLFDIAATEGVSLFRPQEDCLLNSELIREGALFQTMSMEQHLTEQLNWNIALLVYVPQKQCHLFLSIIVLLHTEDLVPFYIDQLVNLSTIGTPKFWNSSFVLLTLEEGEGGGLTGYGGLPPNGALIREGGVGLIEL